MIKTNLDHTSFNIGTYAEPGATGKKVNIVFSHDHIHGEELVLIGEYRYVIYITDFSTLTTLNERWVYEFGANDLEVLVDNS